MADVSHIEILDGGYYDIKDENARAANDHQEQLLIELSRVISDEDVDNVLSGNQPGGSQRLTLDGLSRFYAGLPKGGGGEGGSYDDGPVQDATRNLVVGYNQSLATVIPERPGWDELKLRTAETGTSIDSRLDSMEGGFANLRSDVDGLLEGGGLSLLAVSGNPVTLSSTPVKVINYLPTDDSSQMAVRFNIRVETFTPSGASFDAVSTSSVFMSRRDGAAGVFYVSVNGGYAERSNLHAFIANMTVRLEVANGSLMASRTSASCVAVDSGGTYSPDSVSYSIESMGVYA